MPADRKPDIHGSAWTRAAAGWLRKHPWCCMCAIVGRRRKARNVDHKVPHRGDWKIFWNKANWQGLCDPHHNSTKQRAEGGRGKAIESGFDEHGNPTDPAHHWNTPR